MGTIEIERRFCIVDTQRLYCREWQKWTQYAVLEDNEMERRGFVEVLRTHTYKVLEVVGRQHETTVTGTEVLAFTPAR